MIDMKRYYKCSSEAQIYKFKSYGIELNKLHRVKISLWTE